MPANSREYVPRGLSGYKTVDEEHHIYEKELIYEDSFLLKNPKASLADFLRNAPDSRYGLEVEEEAVRGWASTGNLMLSKGFEVPMHIGHTGTEKKAQILRFHVKKNPLGKPALYGMVQFPDKETADIYKETDISVVSEEEAKDPQGNKYKWPITRVDFTDYPSIPKLEPFRAIAASLLDEPNDKDKKMPTVKPTPVVDIKDETIDTILKKYGVTVEDGATEEQKKEALTNYLKSVNEKFGIVVPSEPATPTVNKVNNHIPTVKSGQEPVKVAAGLLNTVTSARKAELEHLVKDGKITPAQRDKLVERWCSKEKVTIACSMEESDGFDDEVELLKMNEARKGEQTGDQRIELSAENSTLIADAKRRAEEAQKKRQQIR